MDKDTTFPVPDGTPAPIGDTNPDYPIQDSTDGTANKADNIASEEANTAADSTDPTTSVVAGESGTNDSGSVVEEPIEPLMDVCGLDSCTCHDLLASFSTPNVSREFPYLAANEQGVARCQLLRQYEELAYAYQDVVTQTTTLLLSARTDQKSLVDFLEKLETTRPHPNEEIPVLHLFHPLRSRLRAAKSTREVIKLAISLSTMCNYHVMTDIMSQFGDKQEARYNVHMYVEKFNFFNQRTVHRAPRVMAYPRKHGYAFLLIHIDWDPTQRTIHELEGFRLSLSVSFRLTHYTLMLVGVEMRGGVMVQVYQVPAGLRDHMLPLTEKQKFLFNQRKILKVECCGKSEKTKYGDEMYELLSRKTIDYSGIPSEDSDFVTPPSSPPPSVKATPTIPDIGCREGYILSQSSCPNVTKERLDQLEVAFKHENCVCVSDPAHNPTLLAMMVCQHVKDTMELTYHAKCVIVVNKYRRAQVVFEEMKEMLPDANIKCFTGADADEIGKELKASHISVVVCTAGKLLGEIEKGNFWTTTPISLLLVDRVEDVHHETSVEDLMQVYIEARRHEKIGRGKPAQVVAFTNRPHSGIYALTVDEMVDHLINLCGLVWALSGLHLTEQIHSELFQAKDPLISVEMESILIRYGRLDTISMLCTEIERQEQELDMVYWLQRWRESYRDMIQEKKSLVPEDAPNRQRLLAAYDLLTICSHGVRIIKETDERYGSRHLKQSREGFGDGQPELAKVYDLILTEYDNIMEYEVSLEKQVAAILLRKLSENREWRGYLFVDTGSTDQDTLMVEALSSTIHHARPVFLQSRYLSISKLNKKRGDIEMIEAFKRDDIRLIMCPFEPENCDDISMIDLPSCNFIVRLRRQDNEARRTCTFEEQYTWTFVSSPKRKTLLELSQSLQITLLESALEKIPPNDLDFERAMGDQQREAIREYTNRSYNTRRALTRRKKKKGSSLHNITLRCRKCRVYVCNGNQLFTLFTDGKRNHVVPHHGFTRRFSVKKFRPVSAVPKKMSRLQKMYCNSCNSEWGHVCYFPKRGIELPVLQAKNFLFETKHNLHRVKMWPDASFQVPALGACSKYFGEDSDPE